MKWRVAFLLLSLGTIDVAAQARPSLEGLDARTRQTIVLLADSLTAVGLPAEPVYAKAAEGKLKRASDAQIIDAVRRLADRLRAIKLRVGPLSPQAMTAAASALSAGVPLDAIREMNEAARGGRDAEADLASALVTATDLVAHGVQPASAVSSVQSLLARRAPADQYAKLRLSVANEIRDGRSPEQALRSTTESIIGTSRIKPPAP